MGKLLALAFSSREFSAKVCSMEPLTQLMMPFCVDVSMMLMVIRYLSRCLAMILWNTFPMQLVRAMGLNFVGSDGFPASWMRVIFLLYQLLGPGSFPKRIFENKLAKK